jgi:hypothetical protein
LRSSSAALAPARLAPTRMNVRSVISLQRAVRRISYVAR